MTRIDWIVLNRVGSRVGVTVLIFYGIIMLAESLDTWRFNFVADNYGVPMAALMVAMSAVRWTIKTLPVTVLIGAILGFLDLKARHELTVIQSSPSTSAHFGPGHADDGRQIGNRRSFGGPLCVND